MKSQITRKNIGAMNLHLQNLQIFLNDCNTNFILKPLSVSCELCISSPHPCSHKDYQGIRPHSSRLLAKCLILYCFPLFSPPLKYFIFKLKKKKKSSCTWKQALSEEVSMMISINSSNS